MNQKGYDNYNQNDQNNQNNQNYNNQNDPNNNQNFQNDPNNQNFQNNPNAQNNNNFNSPVSLSGKLNTLDAIFIKQKRNIAEAFTGCDLQNKYYVYKGSGKEKKSGQKLFKIKEKSSIYQRCCVPLDCREIEFKIYNYLDKDESDENKKCLIVKKPCTLTCLCCNRPNIEIIHVENDQKVTLGKVSDPWDCCNYNFVVYDDKNSPKFRLVASCLQCAFWCNGFPCKACEEAVIDILDFKSGENLGSMKKKSKNCLDQAIFDTGNYFIPFTKSFTWQDKCLLMCSAIFIDFVLFQNNDQKDNQGGF